MLVESQSQDVPLQGIGVLEFVDQRHSVPLPDPGAGAWPVVRVGQHIVQQHEQIVEITQSRTAFAAFGFGAHGAREGDTLPCRTVGARREVGVAVVDRRQRQGVGIAHREGGAVAGVAGQIQVVGDGTDEFVHRFDQPGARIVFTGQTEFVEHPLTERVGGGDGARVEIGEGGEQAAPAQTHGRGVGIGHRPDEFVLVVACRVGLGQGGRHRDETIPGAFAQFLGGRPAERDQQQFGDRDTRLGDVAHREPDDGVRFAGARAGLEHGGALGQRTRGVERGRCRYGARHGCP